MKKDCKGPYTSTDSLEDRSGIYVVFCKQEGTYYPLDVGESAQVRSRLDTHNRENCWREKCEGALAFSVCYTPNLHRVGRLKIEQRLRAQFKPLCGV